CREYLKRTLLYKKPIWQCEVTGKTNLTFVEALKSEKGQVQKTETKLSPELQKQILLHIQFQTLRLDSLVDDTFKHLSDLICRYHGKVLESFGDEYKVQLLDEESHGIEDMIKTLPKEKIKRERFAFSKNLLKKFLKEHTLRDGYLGAPWNIKEETALKFEMDTTLPEQLYEARNAAFAKSRKKRPAEEAAATMEKAKVEQAIRYPIEDLNLPVYRRDPSGFGKITDMTPGTEGARTKAQNPTGGMTLCPAPTDTSVPQEVYGSFLMIWSFLSVFASPLRLAPFSLDDFESALQYKSPSTLMRECNVALLNVIIQQRERLKKESLGNGSTALAAAISLYGSGYQVSCPTSVLAHQENLRRLTEADQNIIWRSRPAIQPRHINPERGVGSPEIEALSHAWDHGTVDTEEEREGWEDILIGFLNQLAPVEKLDEIDRILATLVLFDQCTLEDREDSYAGLSLKEKLIIFELLISVANESFVIKYVFSFFFSYPVLNSVISHTERRELEDKQNEENNATKDRPEELSESDNESTTSDNEDNALLKAQRQQEYLSRHESRQEVLKRRQVEREERESKRMKLHNIQREEARVKSQEQKQRNEARKRLDDEERLLHKKEEQVERDLRKYNTHRIKPLGRDKFFNRYYYLDDIGGTLLNGTGRLFVQCPSDTDLILIQERDRVESFDGLAEPPCGRGGGVDFVTELLNVQGFETDYIKRKLEFLNNRESDHVHAWWRIYDKPEQLDGLLSWLNPKGVREFRLKREIEKFYQPLVSGMKKRATEQANTSRNEVSRRATRNKTITTFPAGSWLAYTNKFA
ncbi:hypothetical protein BY458DRAFT_445156, partial [Sporodiniella umbellata]